MPNIGDKLAYDWQGIIIATIVSVIATRPQGGFLVLDNRGERHIAVQSGPNIAAPFYVDHLAETFAGTQFIL